MKKGFTLIEFLISVSIFTGVFLVVAIMQKDIIFFNKTLYDSLAASEEGKLAMKTMSAELRSMQSSNNGSYALVEASTTAITFFTDMNGDGIKEQIRYYMSTTSAYVLMKQVIKPTGNPLTYNASSAVYSQAAYDVKNTAATPVFLYYDSEYDGTTSSLVFPISPQQVRLVKITLVIERDPIKAPNPTTYSTQVSLRNLKDNL